MYDKMYCNSVYYVLYFMYIFFAKGTIYMMLITEIPATGNTSAGVYLIIFIAAAVIIVAAVIIGIISKKKK